MFNLFKRPELPPELEDRSTPLEIAALIEGEPHLRDAFQIGRLLAEQAPKRFKRRTLSPGVDHCTAGLGAKRLLVCFAGRRQRFMGPVSVLLQTLDDQDSDLLLLFDQQMRHFNDGIAGFASSLPHLAKRVADFAAGESYRSVMTLGWSMGALPSLRVGRLMGAKRAISISGRLTWHIQRLKAGNPFDAFDPLCGCTTSATSCLLFYGSGHAEDALSARVVEGMLPGSRRLEGPSAQHNVINQYFKAGSLPRFYELLINEEQEPRQSDLDALQV